MRKKPGTTKRKVLANSGRTQEQIDATRPASMLDNTTDWLDEAFRDGKTYNVELQASGAAMKKPAFSSPAATSIRTVF
jgi:hypothetical protein